MRPLKPLAAIVGIVSLVAGCSMEPAQNSEKSPSMQDLVFLTRNGCMNTVTMRANLDEALKVSALPGDYQFIDADTLAASDPRGGYGTPTVLYRGRDIFGMEEPAVPHPPPT